MSIHKTYSACEDVLTEMEVYLAGGLGDEEAGAFVAHMNTCDACARELQLARSLHQALRALPTRRCPDEVTRSVYAQIRAERIDERRRGFFEWYQYWKPHLLRPVLALIVLFTITLGGLLTLQSSREEPPLTNEQVERAVDEVKWTLAYLGMIGRKTGEVVRDEVLESKVVAPVQRVLDQALQRESETQ